ncbi:MAG TPA: hypothetical protein VGC38_02130 [Pseudolabrys sp.]
MSLVWRIVVIFFALILASMAAGIALAIGIISPDWTGADSDPFERVSFFVFAFFATSFVGAAATLPALVLIVYAEAARMRSILYYGVAGAVVGLAAYFGSDVSGRLDNTTDVTPVGHALQLAAAAGIIGGLVYWLVAGRRAGVWRGPASSV